MFNAPEMDDIFSASFGNNLHIGYILANMNFDQNNLGSQNNVTTIHDILTNNGINSCEVSVKPKLEFHTDDQNCNILSHGSKTELVKDNKYQISNTKHMLDILTDLSLTNIDRQLPNQHINSEYNIIDYQANSDHFTDSGCCSTQSIIDNSDDVPPKEYINDSKNGLISINVSHLKHPYDIKNVNIERNFTFDNEFKDNDLDSNCSGYNSSDFEFIDENEAKMFNITYLDTNIANRSDVSNKETSLSDTKDRNKSFNNCLNHLKAGDDFLVLFQTAAAHNFDFVEHNCNFIPTTNRPRLRFEIEKFDECKDSEDDVRDAKETENTIFSMYPRQNRYYKAIL